ncbi:hypothetical protein CW304_09935 [Bacillus sp. UFRGS-B20]|nr:hypothetical protein CW304_09935 [Bacillus sp. UFRGS-B20]
MRNALLLSWTEFSMYCSKCVSYPLKQMVCFLFPFLRISYFFACNIGIKFIRGFDSAILHFLKHM